MIGRQKNLYTKAYGLLELAVVLVVVLVLFSVLLPAVHLARGSARKSRCEASLRQIGIGFEQFVSSNGRLPPHAAGVVNHPGDFQGNWNLSAIGALAPFFGMEAVSPAVETTPDGMSRNADDPTAPSILHCSDDPCADARASSFRVCMGSTVGALDGAFKGYPGRRLSEVLDGLAHTVFVSERLVFDPNRPQPSAEFLLMTSATTQPLQDCLDANESPGSSVPIGLGMQWLSGSPHQGAYAHSFAPNSALRDCYAGSFAPSVITARSNHGSIVNALFADGSARSISSSIDLSLWRAFATIKGAD